MRVLIFAILLSFAEINTRENMSSIPYSMIHGNASFSLLLPGKVLHFNALNEKTRFRDQGNKAGAKQAWKELEINGLGTFVEKPAGRGTRDVST